MAIKSELILVISESMDGNKKPDRDEQALIRCSAPARKALGFQGPLINVTSKAGDTDLKIHQAFSKDLRALKESGNFSSEQLNRVGFVTTEVFNKLKHETGPRKNISVGFNAPKLKKILLGADPEFLLFDDNGKVVRANNIMQKNGPIGSDGAMMEVRPNPFERPEKVVESIATIFSDKELTHNILNFIWKAGVYHKDDNRDYPIGGHIHIGNPVGISRLSSSNRKYLFAVINKILDELLAIPMIKLDGKTKGNSRRSDCQMVVGNGQGYGYFGEWRECAGHLEHRTLSGLWLMHPRLAYLVLGVAKAIAEAAYSLVVSDGFLTDTFVNKNINTGNYTDLYRSSCKDWETNKLAASLDCITDSGEIKNTLNNSMVSKITKVYLKNWYNKLRKLSTYSKYSECIDGLYELLQIPALAVHKEVGTDLKKNWIDGSKFIL